MVGPLFGIENSCRLVASMADIVSLSASRGCFKIRLIAIATKLLVPLLQLRGPSLRIKQL